MNRKPLFDLVRRMLGRGFRRAEVDALDRVLDVLAETGQRTLPHRVSAAGMELIQRYEGCALMRSDGLFEAYPDPGTGGAPWTIGWGATGNGIGPETVWTRDQCDERLIADIARHARDVARAIGKSPTSQPQFDALVSFHYNTGAIHRATLTRHHCSGHFALAASEFARWNKAGGRVFRGLVRRRRDEAKLYRSGS